MYNLKHNFMDNLRPISNIPLIFQLSLLWGFMLLQLSSLNPNNFLKPPAEFLSLPHTFILLFFQSMARLIQPLRKTLLCPSSSSTLLSKNLPLHLQQEPRSLQFAVGKFIFPFNPKLSAQYSRNYISEMRKYAFEGNILRLLRNEIQYELERSPPTEVTSSFNCFHFDYLEI